MKLYLYLLSQDEKDADDIYDMCVVAAASAFDARRIHPGGWKWDWVDMCWSNPLSVSWASNPEIVHVQYLGEAAAGTEAGVICASFNAG